MTAKKWNPWTGSTKTRGEQVWSFSTLLALGKEPYASESIGDRSSNEKQLTSMTNTMREKNGTMSNRISTSIVTNALIRS